MGQDSVSTESQTFDIVVDQSLAPYMADAAARLGYVERDFTLTVEGVAFRVTTQSSADRAAIARKINHVLYREKIRAESLPLRARFLDLLSRR